MVKLRKLLSDPCKVKRRRRILLNMQFTILAWLVEFVGFLVIFLGIFIIGKNNSIITFCIQNVTALLIFILVPSSYLINNSRFKSFILNSALYIAFIDQFFPISLTQTNLIVNNENVENQNNVEDGQDNSPVGDSEEN